MPSDRGQDLKLKFRATRIEPSREGPADGQGHHHVPEHGYAWIPIAAREPGARLRRSPQRRAPSRAYGVKDLARLPIQYHPEAARPLGFPTVLREFREGDGETMKGRGRGGRTRDAVMRGPGGPEGAGRKGDFEDEDEGEGQGWKRRALDRKADFEGRGTRDEGRGTEESNAVRKRMSRKRSRSHNSSSIIDG